MADDHTTFAHPPDHVACAVPRGLERLARFDELDADEQTAPTDVADVRDVGETGMQASHSSLGTSLSAVARGCGIRQVMEIRDPGEVAALATLVNGRQACALAQVHVRAEDLPRALPSRDSVHLKNRFRSALGLPTF